MCVLRGVLEYNEIMLAGIMLLRIMLVRVLAGSTLVTIGIAISCIGTISSMGTKGIVP